MPSRIDMTSLNARTIDILNVIRQNASAEYQDLVPEITDQNDIPKVGEILYGYPAMANQFLSSLMNRIARVVIDSLTFNNPYSDLKKGRLEFGETVEEIFVEIAKARVFSYEKAPAREFARSMPDVRTAYHVMNWNVQYPITVTEDELRKAFLSMNGVQDLIGRIVDSVYRAAELDEFLLFKYLIIKGVANGKMYPVNIGTGDTGDMTKAAVVLRGTSNQITFPSTLYNAQHVRTNTPKEDQYIFLDAQWAAQFDVEVLAAAFNMDKATFAGHVKLIDSWTDFDNERFSVIREESNMIDEVTPQELALMANVKAVLVDKDWFQIYDYQTKITEKFVASGDYWNYFYKVQKSISSSPFANAIVYATNGADITEPASITGKVAINSVDDDTGATIVVVQLNEVDSIKNATPLFVQTEAAKTAGIAIDRYGAVRFPNSTGSVTLELDLNGTTYTAGAAVTPATAKGTTVTFTK